jgi:ERCC4-type nuclease
MKIIIDERETALYDLCPKTGKIAIEKKVLNLGDIIFANDDETSIYMVIERKSFRDLLASIKDGRYAEQSYRLTNCFPEPHNTVYLLEGMFSTLPREEDKKLVISCMASLNFFKGFSVMRTTSIAETAQHIVYMAEKIDKELKAGKEGRYFAKTSKKSQNVEVITNEDKAQSSDNTQPTDKVQSSDNTQPTDKAPLQATATLHAVPSATDYCGVVKASKKANITKENIGQMILMQIPGISSITAIEIMRPFANLLEFIDKIREDKTYLNSVILEAGGKKRKLGSNIVKSINELLLNE